VGTVIIDLEHLCSSTLDVVVKILTMVLRTPSTDRICKKTFVIVTFSVLLIATAVVLCRMGRTKIITTMAMLAYITVFIYQNQDQRTPRTRNKIYRRSGKGYLKQNK
jgi:hypothetical protein